MVQISKKRLFIKHGILYAELNAFFQKILAEDGYTGLDIRPRGGSTDIVLMVTRTQAIIGEKGRTLRELTTLVQRKFGYEPDKIRLYVDKVQQRALSAAAQCESLRYKLSNGIAVRKACYSIVRFIMDDGAKGCEVVVSGKIRGQRAKSMKFVDGVMIHAGDPVKTYVDTAIRHVLLKQGVLGIKVKINKSPDQAGGALATLPDHVIILSSKDDTLEVDPKVEAHVLDSRVTQHSAQPEPSFARSGRGGFHSYRNQMDRLADSVQNRMAMS